MKMPIYVILRIDPRYALHVVVMFAVESNDTAQRLVAKCRHEDAEGRVYRIKPVKFEPGQHRAAACPTAKDTGDE